jgi:cell division septation protein DedD
MHDGADDAFHEIQLSGKQLVFLFMATTVVSVVIFLCGVLVGRGVKGDAVSAADATTATAGPAASSPAPAPSNPAPVGEPRTPTPKDYSYSGRLEGDKPVSETLKTVSAEPKPPAKEPEPVHEPPPPAAPPPAAATPRTTTPPASQTPAPVRAETPAVPASQPSRSGTWAVQVVALTDRAAATAVVQRLAGKGYPAFLVTPQPGAPVQNYKVQVGRYNDRSEAEQIKSRLKKEEQFEPWILR